MVMSPPSYISSGLDHTRRYSLPVIRSTLPGLGFRVPRPERGSYFWAKATMRAKYDIIGVTTLVTLLKYVSKEARDAAISTGMTDGMEVSYARLEKLVAEQQEG